MSTSPDAGRHQLARRLSLITGALALITFFLTPTLHGEAFIKVIAQPAYGVPGEPFEPAEVFPKGLVEDEEGARTLSPIELLELGELLKETPTLNPEVRYETGVIGRFFTLLALSYLGVALLGLLLPWLPGGRATSTPALIALGVATLVHLAIHLLTVGLDLMGVVPIPFFTWTSHLSSALIVIASGAATGIPLGGPNTLRVVIGTLAGFLVTSLACGLYLIL